MKKGMRIEVNKVKMMIRRRKDKITKGTLMNFNLSFNCLLSLEASFRLFSPLVFS